MSCTVGQLKDLIADLPDGMPVLLCDSEGHVLSVWTVDNEQVYGDPGDLRVYDEGFSEVEDDEFDASTMSPAVVVYA